MKVNVLRMVGIIVESLTDETNNRFYVLHILIMSVKNQDDQIVLINNSSIQVNTCTIILINNFNLTNKSFYLIFEVMIKI